MKDFCSRDESTTILTSSTGSNKMVEQYKKKFIKEARNLARLHHPNIINVIDVFEENSTVYYTMPYLAGGSLQDYVKAHGPLSESEAMKYIRQIASALKYMHEEEHICHYDVKPANILLDDKDNAVLIDFGISKNYDAAGHETTTTPVGMSEGYAPIEQYQQNVEEFSPVSDVYALGATLYFLLHGKRPVSAVHRASGTALLMSKQLSQGIKDIINASMKVSKRERAQNVEVFLGNINVSAKKQYSPVQNDDEATIIEKETEKPEAPSQAYTSSIPTNNTSNNSSYIGWVIGIVVAAIIGIYLMFSNNNSSLSQAAESEHDSIMPTGQIVIEEEKDVQSEKEKREDIANAYASTIDSKNSSNEDNYSCEYFMCDITNDGIPELWIKTGTCELDYNVDIYTFNNKIKKIGTVAAFHSSFFEGKGYVLQLMASQGAAVWTRLSYNGSLQQTVIYEENIDESGQDGYREPNEKYIELYSARNKSPIYNYFNF